MPSHILGSIGFSIEFSRKEEQQKREAIKALRCCLNDFQVPLAPYVFEDAVREFEDEVAGFHSWSTEEIIRVRVPQESRGEIERLGFRLYPVSASV